MGMRQDEIGEKTGWNVNGWGSEEVVVVLMCLSPDGKSLKSTVTSNLNFLFNFLARLLRSCLTIPTL